ncbi:hypothetical protein N7504_006576 [Penicillium tannophilum]|nr:hypothetical protein N7504_006576 [Penicillium tannophilum]
MSEPFALALLKKLADYETEEDEAKELIRLLGYLPLAINIIAGHIKSRPRSRPISRILREFQDAKGERKPFSREDGSLIRRFQHTFEMALDDLERRSPASMELLFLMSFFDPEGFTENLLKRSPDEMDTNSDGRFADDVLVLKNLAFVKEVEGKFSLHRLIQGEVKIRLEESGQSERWRKQFIRNLSREFPTFELDSSSWDHARETCQFLFPHLKAAMLQPPNSDAESTLEWAELLQRGARHEANGYDGNGRERTFAWPK